MTTQVLLTAAVLACCWSTPLQSQTNDAELDTSFNPENNLVGYVSRMALQPDGKILLAGLGGPSGFKLARLNPEGSVDSTFSMGWAPTSSVYAIALQDDGRILVGGYFKTWNGIARTNLVRLNQDGSVDATFVPPWIDSGVYAISPAAPDKVLLAGSFMEPTPYHPAWLNSDGSFDSTFQHVWVNDVMALVQLPDRSFLVGGGFEAVVRVCCGDSRVRKGLARLDSTGHLDEAFAPNLPTDSRHIVLQPDGKILVLGLSSIVTRLNPNGGLDLSFNSGSRTNGNAYSIALQPDGRILIGGMDRTNGQAMLVRLNSDGTTDSGFRVTLNGRWVNWLVSQPDGNVLVGGEFSSVNGVARNGIARLGPPRTIYMQVQGKTRLESAFTNRGSVDVAFLNPFGSGTILYTADGSDPRSSGRLCTGPFIVSRSATLRAVAYNGDFTRSIERAEVAFTILPTLAVATDGGGTVAMDPPAGPGPYKSNAVATITASPASGWTFLQWLNDASGDNPTNDITVRRDKQALAVFGTSLSTNIIGSGSLVVSPQTPRYPYGTLVRLTAVPQTNSYFAFWGGAASGTDNPLTFVVTNPNPAITAVFSVQSGTQSNALTVIPNGMGQVTVTPPGTRFARNTNVVLEAVPAAGQSFLGWTGATSGNQNPLTVTVKTNTVLTANFTKHPRVRGDGRRELMATDGFRLTLTAEFGLRYRIDGSTNLVQWAPLTWLTNAFGLAQFDDGPATNLPQRFYRVVEEP